MNADRIEFMLTNVENHLKNTSKGYPKLKVVSSNKHIIIQATFTGFEKDEISISYKYGFLCLRGDTSWRKQQQLSDLVEDLDNFQMETVNEIHLSNCYREIPLDDNLVDINNMETKLENGLLTLTVPIISENNTKTAYIGHIDINQI
jgi:HSP20 family molecular chaperone IbpA